MFSYIVSDIEKVPKQEQGMPAELGGCMGRNEVC